MCAEHFGQPGHDRWTGRRCEDRQGTILSAEAARGSGGEKTVPLTVGLSRNLSGDASKEMLPGGGASTQCCHTPVANPVAVLAATMLDRRIGLLAYNTIGLLGYQHMAGQAPDSVRGHAERCLHEPSGMLLEKSKALPQ